MNSGTITIAENSGVVRVGEGAVVSVAVGVGVELGVGSVVCVGLEVGFEVEVGVEVAVGVGVIASRVITTEWLL